MEFKVGDRVKVKDSCLTPKRGWGKVSRGEVGIVKDANPASRYVDIVIDFPSNPSWNGMLNEIELVPTPHVHAEVIKQWADNPSLTIEVKHASDLRWTITTEPLWRPDYMYRIKEHVKFKEVKKYQVVYMKNGVATQSYSLYLNKEDFEKRNPSGDKEFIGLIMSTEKIEKVEVE